MRVTVDEESEVAGSLELVSELSEMPALQDLMISKKNPYVPIEPLGDVAKLIGSLRKLSSLEVLWLLGLRLKEVPAGIRALKKLDTLGLSYAALDRLPKWLPELDQLHQMDLSGNLFTEFPEVIFEIESLAALTIGNAGNKGIRRVPPDILRLRNLRYLRVHSDSMETPPLEVVNNGVEAVKNYWRQRNEAGVDYLCEAKLVIVGEAGAGKTSLARKIQDQSYELKPSESSTEGIEIIRWSFPAAIRVKHEGADKLISRDFQVNVWDFGGQEVYHATHQFFLTRRSLYVWWPTTARRIPTSITGSTP